MIFNFYYFGAFSVVFFSCEPRINNEYLTKINQMKWLSRACVNGREDVSKHTYGNILFVARSGSEYKQNETIPFWCLLNRLKGCMMVLSINAESVVMLPSAVPAAGRKPKKKQMEKYTTLAGKSILTVVRHVLEMEGGSSLCWSNSCRQCSHPE